MSKVTGFAILLVMALSFVSISCSGTVFKFASAGSPGSPTTSPSAASAPQASVTPVMALGTATPQPHSPEFFLIGGGLLFFAVVGSSIYVCRPPVN